jgi:hypothetical protein
MGTEVMPLDSNHVIHGSSSPTALFRRVVLAINEVDKVAG